MPYTFNLTRSISVAWACWTSLLPRRFQVLFDTFCSPCLSVPWSCDCLFCGQWQNVYTNMKKCVFTWCTSHLCCKIVSYFIEYLIEYFMFRWAGYRSQRSGKNWRFVETWEGLGTFGLNGGFLLFLWGFLFWFGCFLSCFSQEE